MNILSIGNSFSEDATRYLHEIARAEGEEINTANLYIGGCSLEMHHKNTLSGARAYELQYNGQNTGFFVSLDEALENRKWDIVTVQQVSNLSFVVETYLPYAIQLVEYARNQLPDAKIYLHQTWAYEHESPTLKTRFPEMTADEMLLKVKEAYLQAAELINADGIIPCGEAMMAAAKAGEYKLHSDGAHASAGIGKYVLALTWFKTLTGKDITNNAFSEFDVTVTEEERRIAINAVNAVVK